MGNQRAGSMASIVDYDVDKFGECEVSVINGRIYKVLTSCYFQEHVIGSRCTSNTGYT